MPIADDETPRRIPPHAVGEDLASLSLEELTERIAILRSEIARVEEALRAKRASADAADAVFRR